MARYNPFRVGYCAVCGKRRRISARGVCKKCGIDIVKNNIKELQNKKGASYSRWKKNIKGFFDSLP